MTPPRHPAALALAWLPAKLYGAVVRLRNRHYDQPRNVFRAPLPVISVGNLTVGGTGKTPIVEWLARRLLSLGRRPAIVSRGYRGDAGRGPLVVSRGEGPLCDARRAGDEPYELASRLEGVAVIVGSDRRAGALLAAELGRDVAILDDGFQHRGLARDLDLVLLDASNPFGTDRLLPAGVLREPVESLSRADGVLITRSRPGENSAALEAVVRRYNPAVPILYAGHEVTGFVEAGGAPAGRPQAAVAFCGVGNPDRFRADLEAQGVELVAFRRFPDHHAYANDEIAELRSLADARNAALVTTEKDLARLSAAPAVSRPGARLLAMRIEARIHEPRPLADALERVLREAPA